MPVLSVDLACRSWSDLGVVVLEQKGPLITCDIIRWTDPYPPPVVELALRLNALCLERDARMLMLDGPQAWKSEAHAQEFSRAAERAVNASAQTGLPGTGLPGTMPPGTYVRFVGYCLALYEALGRLGWQRMTAREHALGVPGRMPLRILVESYPHAAWKSLGVAPLPARRKCRVSDLAEAFAALTAVLPLMTNRPPNHGQMQAIVGGLPGLAIEERYARAAGADSRAQPGADTRIVGEPPRREGGLWREGFIALPLQPAADREEPGGINWMS